MRRFLVRVQVGELDCRKGLHPLRLSLLTRVSPEHSLGSSRPTAQGRLRRADYAGPTAQGRLRRADATGKTRTYAAEPEQLFRSVGIGGEAFLSTGGSTSLHPVRDSLRVSARRCHPVVVTQRENRVNIWLQQHSMLVLILLTATSAIFLVLSVVFLVLWIRAARERRRQYFTRVDAERDNLDLEASLQEQLGKLRIVRELHEVAVHSVSTIISQADGAQYAATADTGAAVRASATIAEAARSTLADLRRVMTVVGGTVEESLLEPRTDMTRELFDVMRDAGLEITYSANGEPFALGDGPQLAVFRIVQESLSNALKYGGAGTRVRVTATWTDEGLQVVIDDDGVRAAARREGLDPDKLAQSRTYTFQDDLDALTEVVVGPGMSEMRERAALYRGILTAKMLPGVGFTVSAVFPSIRYDNGVHGVNLRDGQD